MISNDGTKDRRAGLLAASVSDYIDKINTLKASEKAVKSGEFYYRGHSSTDFRYIPSILRGGVFRYGELNAIRRIKYEHPSAFASDRYMIESLSRLRHFGFPTRLLDVTGNPLVALYFACCDSAYSEIDGEVGFFGFNFEDVVFMESEETSIIANFSNLTVREQRFVAEHIFNFVFQNPDNEYEYSLEKAMAQRKFASMISREHPSINVFEDILRFDSMKPKVLDMPAHQERIRAQDGSYILFGIGDWDIESQEDYIIHNNLIGRIFILAKHKETILSELRGCGVSSKKLFPELEAMVSDFVSGMWVKNSSKAD